MSHYKEECSCGNVISQCRCSCDDCRKAKFDAQYDNDDQKILLLDFDGTINNYKKFGKNECDLEGLEPIVDKNGVHAFEFIRSCLDNNIKVKIFTTRASNGNFPLALDDWFVKFGMEEKYRNKLTVTNIKGPHDYLLDDRANFEGVYPTAEYIRSFKPWLKR